MEQKVSRLNRYFEEQIALCARRSKELLADDRADEANFEKVRANIYDIFRAVLSAAVKSAGADPDAARDFFVRKVRQIPASWAAAYEKAKQHDDGVRMRLEQLKLDTARRIGESFVGIWEGAQ